MLKNLKNKIFIKILISCAALICLASCSFYTKESPTIYISNSSTDPITNLKIEWAKKSILTLPVLNPGDTKSMSFPIANDDKFFGEVAASWNNGEGDSRGRSFLISRGSMPSLGKDGLYGYVQIYFDQYDFEVLTSDSIDLSAKTRKMDHILSNYRDAFARGKKITQNSTEIKMELLLDASAPTWMSTSY